VIWLASFVTWVPIARLDPKIWIPVAWLFTFVAASITTRVLLSFRITRPLVL